MGVERPTFSESWYRVAELRPRLRSTVQINRQHFRGQTWHVVQDPSNNQFFRLNDPGYRFVALLDGRRTVSDVWKSCNEQLGDSAPTQGEAIQLLGQLYTSNLLQADLAPDAEGLFNRYRKRRVREVQGYLMNLLFIRIPLIDPDRFLDRWAGIFGRIFTWFGFILWVLLLSVGGYYAAVNWRQLAAQSEQVFSARHLAANLPLLYLSFVIIKVIHEFGHAFACKRFGVVTGTGGEVHAMGVMFLVFTPMPYVDASSAWAFRSKGHRALVGAAGMLVELAVASIACMIWANTSHPDVRALTYNMMFLASVSTLLFNGNPLLRYDAYYILSDLIEIPNLAQRSKNYLYYLVRRYAWSVRNLQNPAHSRGEKIWFVLYGIASTLYRVVICVGILLFIADKLFLLGFVLAIAAIVAWVLVPLGKFVRYLATSNELFRTRGRAVLSTVLVFAAVVGGVGFIPAPDRFRAEGVVEPDRLAILHVREPGFLDSYLPSGQLVRADQQTPLVKLVNRELQVELAEARADVEVARAEMIKAEGEGDANRSQVYRKKLQEAGDQVRLLEARLAELEVRPPVDGVWISPQIDRSEGGFLEAGQRVGLVASLDRVIVRATVLQDSDVAHADQKVEMRVMGRPDPVIMGTIQRIIPAGQDQLPSAALGYAVGGSIATSSDDRQGTRAAERFFEVRIAPQEGARLLSGQRVVIRFDTPSKPLARQWWKSLLQLVQRRFAI